MQALKCDRCGLLFDGIGRSGDVIEDRTEAWSRPFMDGFRVSIRVEPINGKQSSGYGSVDLCDGCFNLIAAGTLREVIQRGERLRGASQDKERGEGKEPA